MLIVLVPLAVILLVVGWLFLVAGKAVGHRPAREAGQPSAADPGLPGGRLASRMTEGLDRTARAVDVLVERRPGEEVPRARPGDPQRQRATYVVLGAGLLGLAVVLVLGLVLVVAG